jgi:RNase P/RNase MRP subunit p30
MKIISEKTFQKARQKIQELKNKKEIIIFTSQDDELNRKILEKEQIDILLLNQKNKKDFAKQRNSGLNQVLSKIAQQNKIQIGINLDEVIQSTEEQKSEILSRIKQNIKLCNKYKIQMQFIIQNKTNNRNIKNLKSLGTVLGMPTWMTKNLKLFNC